MNNDNQPKVKQQLSRIVTVLMALTLLTIGICGMSPLSDEIKTGKAYTLGVIFANATKVSKNDSPIEFWINLAWQVFGFGAGIALGIGLIVEMFVNQKKAKKDL